MAASAPLQLRMVAAVYNLSIARIARCDFCMLAHTQHHFCVQDSGTSISGPLLLVGRPVPSVSSIESHVGVSTVSPDLACTLNTLGHELGVWSDRMMS